MMTENVKRPAERRLHKDETVQTTAGLQPAVQQAISMTHFVRHIYFYDGLAMSLPSLTNKSMYEQSDGSYSENGEEKFNFQTPARTTMSPTKAHQTDMFT